ncbi:MAG TPA: GNAT family N-acetyltransferase [Acidimicrobiales bacterium]|nr:GNAT family N-acetyltransferase [Acidimicrobiales bacterium]
MRSDERREPRIELRGFRSGDEERLIELFEVCFERTRSPEEFAWRFERGPSPTQFGIATMGRQILGAGWLQVFPGWVCGELTDIETGGDLMVDPAFRGRGIARMLLAIEGSPASLSVSFPQVWPTGSHRVGQLPQWVRWEQASALRADALWLPLPMARLAVTATRVARRRAPVGRPRIHCREVTLDTFGEVEAALDGLALRSRDFAPFIMRRDAVHIRWRWLDRPDPWRAVVASEVGGDPAAVCGYVAFKVVDAQCRIGDMLALDACAMGALIRAVADMSSQESPERTLFELNDPRPWPSRVLRLAGFLPRGQGPEVSLRLNDERLPESLCRLSSFYLTAGDTDLV